jgi:hypothetical protein
MEMYGLGLRMLVPANFVTSIIGLCFQNVEGFVRHSVGKHISQSLGSVSGNASQGSRPNLTFRITNARSFSTTRFQQRSMEYLRSRVPW